VNLGLALHYPTPFTFLLAITTGALALALAGIGRNPRLAELFAGPARLFLTISSLALLLTGLLQLGPTVLGMFGPAGTGRTLLGIALAVGCVGCLAASLALVPWAYAPAFLAAGLVATLVSWVLWMAFLGRLGRFLEDRTVAEAAAQTCGQVFRALVVTGGFWVASGVATFFAVVIGVLYLNHFPPTLWFLPAAAVGAAAKVAWHFGQFESVVEFALFPTGLPITFEYVHFIGGLRKMFDRQA
jgi:hypothetical protein